MIETVTDFEEFKKLTLAGFPGAANVHYRFRSHQAGSAAMGMPPRHMHFDMTCPAAAVHVTSGKPTHVVRFKYREEWVPIGPHLVWESAWQRFQEDCRKRFIKPLAATEGDWI